LRGIADVFREFLESVGSSPAARAASARSRKPAARSRCTSARPKNSAPGSPHQPRPICTQAIISRIRNPQNMPQIARGADQTGPSITAIQLKVFGNRPVEE